jgi:AraC-like DNA-binding protein
MADTRDGAVSPHPPHGLRFSTDDVPEKDRIAYWRESVGRGIARLEIEPLTDEPFRGQVTVTCLPDCSVMLGEGPHSRYRRTRSLLSDGNDDAVFSIFLNGTSIGSQRGRESVLEPGDANLLTTGEACIAEASRFLNIRMPMRVLKAMAPRVEDQFALRIRRETLALRLLTHYIEGVPPGELAVASPELSQTYANHIRDLVALTLGATGEAAEQAVQGGGHAAQLAMIRREIERGFADPDFSLIELARRTGIHPRHVQRLLEEANSSFIKETLERRLKLARDLLRSPQHRCQSVTEIAYACGFNTDTHFYRQFRQRFGATPKEARAGVG